MVLLWILVVPFLGALGALAMPSNRWRPYLLPATSALQLAGVWEAVCSKQLADPRGLLILDPLGKILLLAISVLFFFCSFSAVSYLHFHRERSNRIFCACLLGFLSAMCLAVTAGHLGLMWIAVEATTLASAPLIYFDHNPRSLEAAWKYLVLCSVGIALGLMGSFVLAYSSVLGHSSGSLYFIDLVRAAPQFPGTWLRVAFAILVVGYGTKMGLAPMHAWLPDAHSEAPAPVSALLSGALLPCAFLAILRCYTVVAAAGQAEFAHRVLLVFGLFSVAVAAVFMASQRDFKRMLAYSSVEHMGILAIGIGTGGVAVLGSLLHILNHAMSKGMLFLAAGNIYLAYGSKSVSEVRGAARRLPFSGPLFFLGFLAITGSPPFGPFVSQFMIVRGTFETGVPLIGVLLLVLLGAIFVGMGMTTLKMLFGTPTPGSPTTDFKDTPTTAFPIAILLGAVLVLGIYHPPALTLLLHDAAASLESLP